MNNEKYKLEFTSKNYDSRDGTPTTILVLHYTQAPFKKSVELLTDTQERPVSSHYLVPESGTPVYQLVSEELKARHAGVSSWRGKDDINYQSIGIEIVNLGPRVTDPMPTTGEESKWYPYPPDQIRAVIKLCKDILSRHPNITPRNIIGHSDVAPTRKTDPGPLFPWKLLEENGIGVWYQPITTYNANQRLDARKQSNDILWCKSALREWGYKVGDGGVVDDDVTKKSSCSLPAPLSSK
eukprot:TRINITY_DN3019_c0_g1_i1.p1 TRINITY_DN3019_c0_g1~~TRINITY_DN3019_c0_g1_i1.p1  ORF type:complete len:239 (+),score=35.54 TRINITY_DN3019_c0_g1_i1:111-827(+)